MCLVSALRLQFSLLSPAWFSCHRDPSTRLLLTGPLTAPTEPEHTHTPSHTHTHTHSHGPKDGKKRFEVRKWTAVAFWSWDIVVDTCAICRNHLMEPCIECQPQSMNEEPECVAAWGECNHAFHMHCISRWLKSRNVCPLDNREWSYQKYGK
ncbi:CYFA0S04e03510g1_1 [Cyberlindnera fabianii]|uniref:CYFA0S04e03510g1_1 n=1 Tax=Cyberlindnera fabianii TaxID=36022 RepID=A0A061AR33_CYBFA|nr:CYFA0S04e03510g1_1 [Cyberlindnera fabianii]